MDDERQTGIDFDTWAALARADPAAFESRRLRAIDALIARARATHRPRLRRLQWRIDQERRLARTPMAACLRISGMMWQSVVGPGGLQQRLGELRLPLRGDAGSADASRRAPVVPLDRGRRRGSLAKRPDLP